MPNIYTFTGHIREINLLPVCIARGGSPRNTTLPFIYGYTRGRNLSSVKFVGMFRNKKVKMKQTFSTLKIRTS